MADFEREIYAAARELILVRLAPAEDPAGFADVEADHVADAVREEDARRRGGAVGSSHISGDHGCSGAAK